MAIGVFSHQDLLRSKWITAIITDSGNRLFFVPIKYTLGDYFITEIEKQIYVFRIEGSRIKTYTHKGIKSFRSLMYDTSNYMPLSNKEVKELENLITNNNLPKVNMGSYSLFKLLGKREKKAFKSHDLKGLIKELQEKAKDPEYAESAKNKINYIENLKAEKIVNPVRKIAEFIEGDLIETDPRFPGNVIEHFQRTDTEHRKVTNTPTTGKVAWMKIIALLAVVGLVGGIGYWVWSSGMLEGGIPGLSFSNKPTSDQLMKQYSSPEAMRAALDSGKLKYEDLPPDIKKMIDNYKPPTVTPTP